MLPEWCIAIAMLETFRNVLTATIHPVMSLIKFDRSTLNSVINWVLSKSSFKYFKQLIDLAGSGCMHSAAGRRRAAELYFAPYIIQYAAFQYLAWAMCMQIPNK